MNSVRVVIPLVALLREVITFSAAPHYGRSKVETQEMKRKGNGKVGDESWEREEVVFSTFFQHFPTFSKF